MQHITRLEDAKLDSPTLVTIGVFDGVHRGHQSLIKRVVAAAQEAGQQSVVLTFAPHPDVVLRNITGRYYLTTPAQRAQLMGELGVDVVVTHPFNEAIRQIRAHSFVDKLLQYLKMKTLWVGKDFALGYQREGTVNLLTEYGAERGYAVQPIELLDSDDDKISSSTIRDLLADGDIEAANALLGRSYSVSGEVVRGDQRGRLIGFPTANTAVWEEQVLPANGVYACHVYLGHERFMAVTNVGVRPTFDGTSVTIEPHILDFDRDIYGQTLTIAFEKRLRGEQKFDGIDAVKAQIARDAAAGRAFLQAR